MKILLAGVNCKYVHTNLALRYLKCVTGELCDVVISEFNINDNVISVERKILIQKPEIVAFSCYIWNIDFILQLCSDLKKALPNLIIILGGPEVSYDCVQIMVNNDSIDYIIKGEGEIVFPNLIKSILFHTVLPKSGVVYRENDNIIETQWAECPDFSFIPFPYADLTDEFKHKILYYESSRGCPYSCKYCLSGDSSKLRFKEVNEVCRDLSFFDTQGVELVKFVDRTFNADKKRANKIWHHISTLSGNTRFHMEISGELLDDEAIDVLKTVPSDKLQFEIGVQSTNPHTIDAIARKSNINKLFDTITKVLSKTSIHIHLDLIVGLPYEDMSSFKKSFCDVVALRPQVLQIGFLKVLKGSAMHREAEKYGIIYRDKAPYEIISNPWLSYDEVLYLKDFEFVFDKIYNSGSFCKTIDYLFSEYDNPYEVFEKILLHFQNHNLINASFSKDNLFSQVYDCFSHLGDKFEVALRYDYIFSLKSSTIPRWSKADPNFRYSEEVYAFLRNEELKRKIMPKFYDVPAKTAIKQLRFERIGNKIVVFDLKSSDVYDVTKYFPKSKKFG